MQVGNTDLKFKKMGLIGTLKIVSCLGDANNATSPSLSQVELHLLNYGSYVRYQVMTYASAHKLISGSSLILGFQFGVALANFGYKLHDLEVDRHRFLYGLL